MGYRKLIKILALIILSGLAVQLYLRFAGARSASSFKEAISTSPTSINPFTLDSPDLYHALSLVIETLAQRDPRTNSYVPLLAEQWHVAPDRKSVVVNLRKNAHWHDGKPVTADDVVFSWRALRDPTYKGLLWGAAYHDFESAIKVNSHSVRFTWQHAHYDNLVQMFLLRILPQHFFEPHKSDSAYLSRHLIGSGPYRVHRLRKNHSLELVRNSQWWGQNLPIFRDWYNFAGWNFIYINSLPTAQAFLRREQLHFFALRDPVPDTIGSAHSTAKKSTPFLAVTYQNQEPDRVFNLACNLKDSLLASLPLRKALNHLIPRQEINRKFFAGRRQILSSPWGHKTDFLNLAAPLFPYSPSTAQELLKADGWQMAPDSVWMRERAGQAQALSLRVTYYQPHLERLLTYLQEKLRHQGVHLNLQLIAGARLPPLIRERKFQLLAYEEGAFGEIIPEVYHSQGKYNTTGLANREVDKLITQLQEEFTASERKALEKRIANVILTEVTEIFGLSDAQRHYLVHPRIHRPQDSWPYNLGLASWSFAVGPKD